MDYKGEGGGTFLPVQKKMQQDTKGVMIWMRLK